MYLQVFSRKMFLPDLLIVSYVFPCLSSEYRNFMYYFRVFPRNFFLSDSLISSLSIIFYVSLIIVSWFYIPFVEIFKNTLLSGSLIINYSLI